MFIGAAAKIEATITGVPDSVKISIFTATGNLDIDNIDMTDEGDGLFSYIYQSDSTNGSGNYKAIIKAQYGKYTDVDRILFELEEV